MTDPSVSLPGDVLAASRVVRRAGYAIVKRDALAELRADRDQAREMVAALEAENARIAELHGEYRIYDDCGHEHAEGDEGVVNVNDVGLVCEDGYMYSVCRECCTDDAYQTEECASAHDHPGWLCATNTILRAAEAGEGA